MPKAIKTVYLDMDGVLVDFYPHFEKVMGFPFYTEVVENRDANFRGFVAKKGFTTAPFKQGAQELYKYLVQLQEAGEIKLNILTAAAGKQDLLEEVTRQKSQWLRAHGLNDYNQLEVSLKGVDKSAWAKNSNCFLIDDTAANCQAFTAAGGKALRYTGSLYAVRAFLGNVPAVACD